MQVGEFGVEQVKVVEAAVESLSCQSGEIDFGDVEPGAVLGCVVNFQAVGQHASLGGLACFV